MKRLLCFFDGTWNRPDGHSAQTNVVKLFRVALGHAPDGTQQIARYVEGIGTDPDDSDTRAFFSGAVGVGIDRRILEGYRFLCEHYEPGDEISLFGFSRGAFQARTLADLIVTLGVVRSDALDRIEAVWKGFVALGAKPDAARVAALKAHGHGDVRIRCLGVWDTVGNLGVPLFGHIGLEGVGAFPNTELSPMVDVGLHALAIDEPRGPFSPTLWTRRRGTTGPAGQSIEQVWFAGSHANVGGGFPDSALSDIALIWMAERAAATAGIAFDMDELTASTSPDPLGELVSPTSDGIYRVSYLLPFVRLIGQNRVGLARWRRMLLGSWRTNLVSAELETMNEAIHESVLHRFGHMARVRRGVRRRKSKYRPRTLAAAFTKGLGRHRHKLGQLDTVPGSGAYAAHGHEPG